MNDSRFVIVTNTIYLNCVLAATFSVSLRLANNRAGIVSRGVVINASSLSTQF